jgi:RND family efflux transporter MFP subunit
MKKILITIIIIAVVAGAGIAVVKHKQKELANLPKPGPQPVSVQTAEAVKGSLEVLSHQIAEIQPDTSADLSPRITGRILSVAKREGDPVEKDEILCVIDDREFADRAAAIQADAAAAMERLAGAKSLYETQAAVTERDKRLFASGAISKEALERSQTALENAKAAVGAGEESIKALKKNADAAGLQSDYAKIRAPFSGVVTKRLAEPGDLASPGKPVLVIEKKLPVRVTAQVPQETIKKLGPGAKVYLTDGKERMDATVTRVYPALGKNFMGSIEIILDQSPFGLSSGATVGVDIVTSTVSGIVVPENAVVHTSKGYFVYPVDKSGVVGAVKQVEFLGSQNGMTAIKGDLAEGTTIAVAQENKLLSLTEGPKTDQGGKQ